MKLIHSHIHRPKVEMAEWKTEFVHEELAKENWCESETRVLNVITRAVSAGSRECMAGLKILSYRD